MKIKVPQTVSNVDSFEDLRKFTDQNLSQIVSVLNGNINFEDNVNVSIVSFTFSVANTNYQVTHSLGIVPTGFIIVGKNISTDIYNGDGVNTKSSIFLKSTVANATVKVMVF